MPIRSSLAAIFAVVGFVAVLWSVLSGNSAGTSFEAAVTGLLSLGLYSIFAGMVGILWSGFVTAVTLPVIYLFVWSLKLRASIVWLGAFSGGLVGFIAALPLSLSMPWPTYQRRVMFGQ